MQISQGKQVTMHFALKLEDGQEVDQSRRVSAEAQVGMEAHRGVGVRG